MSKSEDVPDKNEDDEGNIILKMTWSTMTFLKTIVRTRTMGSMYRMKRV